MLEGNRDDQQMVPINGTNYRVYCSRSKQQPWNPDRIVE